ncbi:MAG: hypothetical protein WCO69_03295 [Candidatus Omnitrophota bacterium]
MKIYSLALLLIAWMFCSGSSIAVAQVETQKPLLPLELSIDATQDSYKWGEQVIFDLKVTNKSQTPVKVFKIDEKSIFCNFNTQTWGSRSVSGDPVVVLIPGESLRKKFILSSPSRPGDLVVKCSYGMGANKVRPEAQKTFNIVR